MKKIFDNVAVEGLPTMGVFAAMDLTADPKTSRVIIRCNHKFDTGAISKSAFPKAELVLDFKSATKVRATLMRIFSIVNQSSFTNIFDGLGDVDGLLSDPIFKPMWAERSTIFNRFTIPYMIYALTMFIEYEFPGNLKSDTELDTQYLSTAITTLDDCIDTIRDLLLECPHDSNFVHGALYQTIRTLDNTFDNLGNYTELIPAEAICLKIIDLIEGWKKYDYGVPESEVVTISQYSDMLYWIRVSLLIQIMDRKYQLAYNAE